MTTDRFCGPLFLVGMPRSGTKLLRSLLNRHRSVYIPDVETHFVPYWHANWASFGDLGQQENFQRFYKRALALPYFSYLRERQAVIGCDEWFNRCSRYDLSGLFETLVRHDAGMPADGTGIWGDKSPSYLVHMPLLKSLFPSARFIHIVRDARDFCLSSRQAWGKNLFRSAQVWADSMARARRDGEALADDYHCLQYENLVCEPEAQLRQICGFLDIEFQPSMLELTSSPENLGDTKGEQRIVPENIAKYRSRMDRQSLDKVEAIACGELRALGYPVAYSGPERRLPPRMLLFYQLLDGLNLIRFEAANRGVVSALKLRWRLFWTSRAGSRPRP